MTQHLSAGVARADITPPPGIAHAGWGAQTHQRAAGVDLPLWATALALSDDSQTVVMVDIDTGRIQGDYPTQIRADIAALTGLPVANIRLSYTHTHSGPITGGGRKSWIEAGAEMVDAYDELLRHQVTGVAWAAVNNLRPARITAGRGVCGIAVNRRFQRPEDGAVVVGRNWDGPVDHEVLLLRIDDRQGHPLATVVNYACHPIIVGPDNDLITPDFPGVVKRVVEQSTGSTCLFFQGAAADIGPIRGVARGGINEYKRLGAILGHEASRLWWEMELPPRRERYAGTLESGAPHAIYFDDPLDDPDITLQVAARPVRLPLRDLGDPDALEAEAGQVIGRLRQLQTGGGSVEEIRWQTMLSKRAAMRARTARALHGQTHQIFELQIFTIGSQIALVALPGEPFVEIGLTVKRESPFQYTFFSGYSNTGGRYIPMPEAYPLGGYEVEWGTPFSPEAAGVVIKESLNLLHRLAD